MNEKNVVIKMNADISAVKEKLSEIEQAVDRITEKISRLKISLSEITQTADIDYTNDLKH